MGLASFANAQDTAPLSAIDWLDQVPTIKADISPIEPPIADGGTVPDVVVGELDAPNNEAVGLLPSTVTGLPATLWQDSLAEVLATHMRAQPAEALPAMQALLYTLLLAEANPPIGSETTDRLLLARIDKLIELGALEQANALLTLAGATEPELFQRWFDVTMLIGEESRACAALKQAPHLAPDLGTRVFCLAREGDWVSAALTLNSARSLNLISDETEGLLARFLDPEIFEGEPLLVPVSAPSPLHFRLYEAIGEPQPTRNLPRAYAHSDLQDTSGWKPRLEAAERLARVGALPENRLFGIYGENKPAASGMIWDRVAAFQTFDSAFRAHNPKRIEDTLPQAWRAMKEARTEVLFAQTYAEGLNALQFSEKNAQLLREILLLSPSYESVTPIDDSDFLTGLAKGTPPQHDPDPTRQAISNAFHGAGVPQTLSNHLARGQLGNVILQAMTLFSKGASGDLPALTNALATFRAVGLEDTARRAALQVLLLERDS